MSLRPIQSLLCLVLSLACTHATATPTALNIIPTADVLPDGVASISIQANGGATDSGYKFMNQLQTQLGIGNDIEFGFDPSLGPHGGTAWNVKYRFCEETRRRPAVAVGILGNIPQVSSPPYMTAFKTVGSTRFHAGVVKLDGVARSMFGWDSGDSNALVLQADYISGPRAYASIGFVVNWSNGWSVSVAQLIGNTPSSPNAYLAIVGWAGPVF